MSGQHTPGRLHVCTHGLRALRDTDGKWVADVKSAHRSSDEDQDNARRLVACWNACESMPTEHIEALHGVGAIGDLHASTQDEVAMLLLAIKYLSEKIDTFVSECIDDDGKPRAPTMRQLMTIRGYLPIGSKMELKKGGK